MDGTVVYDKDGLKVLLTKAENDEFDGPQLAVYVYNGGNESVSLELSELKLDDVSYEAFCFMTVPTGKRGIDTVYVSYDFDNVPVVKEAELTFQMLDPETGEPTVTLDTVKVTFTK